MPDRPFTFDILRNYLLVGAALMALGMLGFLARRNLIVMFLSAEMMLQGTALTLVGFGRYHGNWTGQVFTIVILTVAACEASIALALILVLFNRRSSLDVTLWQEIREPGQPPTVDDLAERGRAGRGGRRPRDVPAPDPVRGRAGAPARRPGPCVATDRSSATTVDATIDDRRRLPMPGGRRAVSGFLVHNAWLVPFFPLLGGLIAAVGGPLAARQQAHLPVVVGIGAGVPRLARPARRRRGPETTDGRLRLARRQPACTSRSSSGSTA